MKTIFSFFFVTCSRYKSYLHVCLDSIVSTRLLPICAIDKVVDLRQLVINNIEKLTDTSLSWIANGCYNLSIFSFKGTSITKHGAKAVRDKFPYSEMVFNDNFCGYWPVPRIDDIKLLNHYYVMRKGIVAIQARARKLIAYKVAAGMRSCILTFLTLFRVPVSY